MVRSCKQVLLSLAAPIHGVRSCCLCMASVTLYLHVQVVEESVADDEMIMIRGCKHAQACTVLLRGANDYMLDEVDRSLHDAFCVVKRVLEYGTVVPGDLLHFILSPKSLIEYDCQRLK